MCQKIQRLLLFSVGMSSLVLVSEPMFPSILPALAVAGQDTVTIHQNNSHEKSQNPGQIDRKMIAQKNELTRATAPSHRLIGRTPAPQTSVEISNDASLKPSLSTSPVASSGADDSQPRDMSLQFSGPSMATPSSQLGGTMQPRFGATPTVQPTSSLLGATAQTSLAVAAPQASPMQTQPSSTPLRRLLFEIPGLRQLVAPSITISSPPSQKPAIGVSSPSFSFTLQQGDGSPTTQTLTVTNIGGGTLDWNAVSTAAWLNLSPASGKDAGTIALTATTGSLAAGTYTALVTVSASNATPVSLPVTFTVTAPSPTLTVNPTAVTFSGVQSGTNPASQSVTVTSNSNWMASSSVPWLTLSPSSGNGNGSLVANVTLASAAVGPNQATITVTSGGVTRTAAVTFTVAAATLTAAPSSLTYTATQGAANPAAQIITVSANGAWMVSDNASWLNLSSTAGNGNGSTTATVTTGSLAAGTYTALVTVNASNATPVSLPVTFTVTAPSPILTVNPTAVTFSGVQSGTNPASQSVTVTSNSNWTASSSVPWLTLSPSSGNGNGSLIANVTLASAAVGPNQATITLTSGGVTRTAAVTFTVAAATLTAAPSSLTYTATQGAANPAAQTITVSANGAWTISDNAAWLNLSSTVGNGNGSTTAMVTTGSLAAGTYTALITVSAPNATFVSIPVTFTVTAPSPTLTVNPTAVTFSGVQGGPNPVSQSVTVNANGNWTASSSVAWLTLSPSSGSGNGFIAANVTLASAAVGPNQATITLTSGGVTRTAAVTFTVAAATLTAAPSSLTYTATRDAANPSDQTITISSNGTWSASEDASWLSLSPSPTTGSHNGTITAKVNTATATQGPNSTTFTVTSGGITRTVNVTLTLNPPASSSVTLTWNANTESDLAGYKVYRRTSLENYGAPIAAIPGNTTSYTVTGLQFNTTYHFVVTAYDIAGNESAYSNEVSKSVY